MVQKPWGAGSLSVPLCLLGVLFSCNLPGGFCLGDAIFSLAGLSAWSAGSSGLHYPPYAAILLFVPAAVLGWRFSGHRLAGWGKWVSTLILAFLALSLLFWVL